MALQPSSHVVRGGDGDEMTTPHPDKISYWIDSTSGTRYPPLAGEIEADVAIVGGGMVGITAAFLLKRAGKTVVVVEMDEIVRGVTGYTTAKVTAGHNVIYQTLARDHGTDAARGYAQANQSALERIVSIVTDEGIDCDLERCDNFVYAESSEDVGKIQAEVEAAAAAGLPVTFETQTDLPFPVAAAVRLPNQAQFHPRKYLLHLAAGIPGDGSHIFEHSRVSKVHEGRVCEVSTAAGSVRAHDVIVATNYPIVDRGLFFPRVHPKRSYAIAGPIDEAGAPAGMYISTEPTHSVRTIRHEGERLLLVGGSGHSVGQDHDTDGKYAYIEEWAAERFGMTEVRWRWSTQDGTSVDGLPYIGTLRRSSNNVFTATAFGKWGMTNGTLAGMMLSERILGRATPWDGLFDPHRVTLGPSAQKFTKENLEVAKHFVGDRISHPQKGRFSELAPGEAAVGRVGLEQVAAYRDEDGHLHAVSAVCTHLRCIVGWNPAERSWDCPCHGSRFDFDGRVLQGPATRDLETKDLKEIIE